MRVAWATDIHLDSVGDPARLFGAIRESGAHALLLGGDIAVAPTLRGTLAEMADAVGMPIHYVLGNHDFYAGSIAEVRAAAREQTATGGRARWLPAAGVTALADAVGLVGVDGWGDGRLGDPLGSRVFLNDWVAIRELTPPRGLSVRTRNEWVLPRLRRLGDGEAEALEGPLREALDRFPEVIVLTHVPPFAEAAWYEGRQSGPDWLPWFACERTGRVLLAAARECPDRRITVLCGHTHGAGRVRIRENLLVLTGGARYGSPSIARVIDLG